MEYDQSRTLEFGDHDLGMLWDLDDVSSDGHANWVDAAGTVSMPSSHRLLLQYRDEPFDLSPLAHLASNDLWGIDLEASMVRDDDLRYLRHLTGLRHLDLSYTFVSDAGLVQLESLQHLNWLGLYNSDVSSQGVERLRHLLPGCDITGLPATSD